MSLSSEPMQGYNRPLNFPMLTEGGGSGQSKYGLATAECQGRSQELTYEKSRHSHPTRAV
ncbi:protein of unknown function [Pseudomonas sp. JV551A1]|nr:protein of unknown function [Pseudomonas sp. JV551A1]